MVSQVSLLYTTFPCTDEAKKVTRILLGKRLIACANLFNSMTSLYSWEGEIQENQEVGVFLKTIPEKVDELIKTLKSLHPYETPATLEIPLGKTEESFGKWVQEELR